MPILDVKHLDAGYDAQHVLFDLSLTLEQGEIVTILGPNGAGKSTLLKALAGIIRPTKGEIFLKDQMTHPLEPHQIVKLGMSWVPQEENVFPPMTVKENLEMGAYLMQSDSRERIEEVCQIFPQLAQRMGQIAGNLSGGQRQMLAIARGLMLHPDVLLLDEPTTGLAPNLVHLMLEKIREIVQHLGSAVLLVTQTIDAVQFCHRGYLLTAGEIIYSDTKDGLLANQDVKELYFGGISKS
jgi:branched-chain amino acid transport system ATP-binding protein